MIYCTNAHHCADGNDCRHAYTQPIARQKVDRRKALAAKRKRDVPEDVVVFDYVPDCYKYVYNNKT